MASISAKSAARKLPLWSFIARESPASLPATPFATPLAFAGPSNPFHPVKNPNARSWTPPKYSLRRQKQLRRAAVAYGFDPDSVLPPAHVKANAPVASGDHATAAERLDANRRMLVGSAHVQGSQVLDALAMPKVGPYAGRRGAPFKGKLWERQKQARLTKLRTLLEGADARIEAWRKSEAAAKSKGKGSLPF
ncbi:hypothetical protein BMF94_3652 [Rhodotorula taiwanensis]|uniref:Large ribosomal subunit protein mL59 domain-containing protein n=1 Tax=Rhodotorula taiwanensis TaxID=741276 RepID=A0A2S5B976_9BASI|nr:hypothetical protein BMF94_3652 [Rhodotorula taiwanensis]